MKQIEIARRIIGPDSPCFIIAEIGMNHNGDTKLARKIIDSASECGCDAVKFQIFTAEKLVTRAAETYGAVKGHLPRYQQEMYKKYELTEAQYKELRMYAESLGMVFLASIFDEENADMLTRVGTAAIKIASMDITHIPLISHAAKKGLPMILSTGMSTPEEVQDAIDAIHAAGNDQIILLHCISSYPSEISKSNLRAISTLQALYPYPAGYSDHSPGHLADIVAVTLGAKVIEKHFTIDKTLQGVDHHLSMDPEEMRGMISAIRLVEQGLGDGIIRPTEAEIETRKMARRSIIARKDIQKGTIITKDMIIIKRPGTGIQPKQIDSVLGFVAAEDIKEDTVLTREMMRETP